MMNPVVTPTSLVIGHGTTGKMHHDAEQPTCTLVIQLSVLANTDQTSERRIHRRIPFGTLEQPVLRRQPTLASRNSQHEKGLQ